MKKIKFRPYLLGIVIVLLFVSGSCLRDRQFKKVGENGSFSSGGSHLAEILERGLLRVVISYNSTDYFVYRGQPMGFQYEILQEFAKDLDVTLEIVVSNEMTETFDLLNSHRVDFIAKGITVTKERKKMMMFTEPWFQTKQVLIQRDKKENPDYVTNVLQLGDKSIYVQEQSAFYDRLQNLSSELGEDIKIRKDSTYGPEQLISMVASGEIDYTITDQYVAKVNQSYFNNIDIEVPISLMQNLSWAVTPHSDHLLEYLNQWIIKFKKTKKYRILYQKYFQENRRMADIRTNYHTISSHQISPYDDLIKSAAQKLDWDWRLLASLICQESRFKPKAKSWSGAQGLMQLMPSTQKRFKVKHPYIPKDNIRGGTEFLIWLDQYFKEEIPDFNTRVKFMLASYNVGLGHVLDARRLARKYGKNPNLWTNNVDFFVLNKSTQKYYKDPVVKWGYCRGQEPYNYVIQILDRYQHFKNIILVDEEKS